MPLPKSRPSSEDRIRAALWFAERGFGVFSVWSTDPDGTCRCGAAGKCESPGKHPVPVNGFKAATTDPERIRTMLSAASEPNWGMLPPEGVFALDVDGEGEAHLAELEASLGPLPPTLRTNTAHGEHVFLRWPEALPRPLGQMFGFVTRWGSGTTAGYVIGPRSVHATGAVYTPGDTGFDIATLPDAWASAVVAPATPAEDAITIHGGYELPPAGYSGSRYDAIRDYVASRYMRGMGKDEVLAGVLTVLAPRFANPLPEPDLRSRFERAWKGTPEKLGPPMAQETVRLVPAEGIDAADLLAKDIAPLRWVVPDLIPEGTTLLIAAPKIGKSWLVYQAAVELAIGGDLLDRRATSGSVLYYALEDGERRGRDRLRKVLCGRTMPRGRLEVRWSANRVTQGLEADIARWLDAHPDAVMVALDTLGRVRPLGESRRSAYDVDVSHLAALQNVFRDRSVALVIVHHDRKASGKGDDFIDAVSGTHGISGSADTTLRIKRARGEAFGTLEVGGRDVPELSLSVRFEDGVWTTAPGVLVGASAQRQRIYEVIDERGPVRPKEIADELGLSPNSVTNMLAGLRDDGVIHRSAAGWEIARVEVVSSSPGVSRVYVSNVSKHTRHTGGTYIRARALGPDTPHDTPQDTSGVSGPVDPLGWAHPCDHYTEHTSAHRRTPSGWTCDACYPEEPA